MQRMAGKLEQNIKYIKLQFIYEVGNSGGIALLSLCNLPCLRSAVCCLISKSCRKTYPYLPNSCDCVRKCAVTTLLLAYVSFYKNVCKKGCDQCIFVNSSA